MKQASSGLSLVEIIIALSIAITIFIPVMNLFSSSGQVVYKTRNFSFANSLARSISQHLMVMPYDEIKEIPLPGISLCDIADKTFFGPFINFSDNKTGEKRITRSDMPEFYHFLNQYDFRYSMSVSNVSFGVGDEIKNVGILITWLEGGKNMIHRLYVNVPSL